MSTMRKPKILLIDDEEGLCRMLEAVLGDEGYDVRAYNRPMAALNDFAAGRYDLVITDIRMPEMTGIEVLQRVKDKDPGIPVIIITAHATVEMSIQAMRRGELDALGILLNKSHESLRDDYEVSSDALDAMVECALAQEGCYGARMTGAGFGGCAVAIVKAESAEAFAVDVADAYRRRTASEPAVYVCHASDGTNIVE